MQFVFAATWALGGAMLVDKTVDYRAQFSKWWVAEWKNVLYPEEGLVFDYYVDPVSMQMRPWEEKVEGFGYNPSEAFANIFVPSVESTRLSYFLNSFIKNKHYCMFVGNAGTGKTAYYGIATPDGSQQHVQQKKSASQPTINVTVQNHAPTPVIEVQPIEKEEVDAKLFKLQKLSWSGDAMQNSDALMTFLAKGRMTWEACAPHTGGCLWLRHETQAEVSAE